MEGTPCFFCLFFAAACNNTTAGRLSHGAHTFTWGLTYLLPVSCYRLCAYQQRALPARTRTATTSCALALAASPLILIISLGPGSSSWKGRIPGTSFTSHSLSWSRIAHSSSSHTRYLTTMGGLLSSHLQQMDLGSALPSCHLHSSHDTRILGPIYLPCTTGPHHHGISSNITDRLTVVQRLADAPQRQMRWVASLI